MSTVLQFHGNIFIDGKPIQSEVIARAHMTFNDISDALKYTPILDPQNEDRYLPDPGPDPTDCAPALLQGAALSERLEVCCLRAA